MFNWIHNLFGRGEAGYDVYKPRERLIFSYWNGKKMVAADPMVLYKRAAAKGADIEVVQKIATNPLVSPTDATRAHDDLIRYIRDIFALDRPEDGVSVEDRLTESECVELLDAFYMFVGAKKKGPSPTPTPVPATSAPSPLSSAAAPPTGSSSGSGSTANAPPTVTPQPSKRESCSPSDSSTPECPTSVT